MLSAAAQAHLNEFNNSHSLGEDIRNDVRAAQDKLWENAVQDGRSHVSHREAAATHSQRLAESITMFHCVEAMLDCFEQENGNIRRVTSFLVREILNFAFPTGHGDLFMASLHRRQIGAQSNTEASTFRLCVRKRPLLAYERIISRSSAMINQQGNIKIEESEEVQEKENTGRQNDPAHHPLELPPLKAEQKCVILHDGRLARNGRRLSMTHHAIHADKVYAEQANNTDFCVQEVLPMLRHIASISPSNIICFGQTGTGKTYTMQACLSFLCYFLMGAGQNYVVFYEVHGKKCYDLLNDRKVCKLLADGSDTMHLRGAKKTKFQSATETDSKEIANFKADLMIQRLADALKLRSAEVTERNPVSSRSHAVCEISIEFAASNLHSSPEAHEQSSRTGLLRIVDLAGSERNYETLQMSAKQHLESADINTALMALKDCFRATAAIKNGTSLSIMNAKRVHVPFRAHLLTRVLKDAFTELSRTTLVATISPSPIDLLHSLNTLEHSILMNPALETMRISHEVSVSVPIHSLGSTSDEPMQEWSPSTVQAWLATVDDGRFSMLQVPQNLDGKGLCDLTNVGLSALFAGTLRQARTDEEGSAWVVDNANALDGGAPPEAHASESTNQAEPAHRYNEWDEGIDMGFISANTEENEAMATSAAASQITTTSRGKVRISTLARNLWGAIRREKIRISNLRQLNASKKGHASS
eukprot:GSChrysophyteH1.ASY1.ANO1.1021.1 assembled CDS